MRFPQLAGNARALVVALVLGVVLAGCGSSGEATLEKAFGGDISQDRTAIQATFKALNAASDADLDISAALNKENLVAARKAVDRMYARLREAEDQLLDVDNAKLSATFDRYLAAMRASAKASDRWIAYFEDDDGAVDKRLEERLLARIDKTGAEVARVDRDLANQLLDAATPEQREEMRDTMRRAQAAAEKRLSE